MKPHYRWTQNGPVLKGWDYDPRDGSYWPPSARSLSPKSVPPEPYRKPAPTDYDAAGWTR